MRVLIRKIRPITDTPTIRRGLFASCVLSRLMARRYRWRGCVGDVAKCLKPRGVTPPDENMVDEK
jgi:hypothetical protein